ncbi:MAG: hypothetical protein LBP80_08305 [Treponema sp.]|jgi:hypothetical protein|nr:hypothetical protein [Treponema sp.]
MKKFLVVSLTLVLLGGFVAAQELGVSAEVTGKYDIVNYTGYEGDGDVPDGYRDTLAGAVPVDGTITFTAEDEAAGLKVVLDLSDLYDLAGPSATPWNWGNDNAAHVWFKPLKNDLLTIRAGANPGESTLRYGNLSSGPDNIISDFGRVIVEDYINGFGGGPYGLNITSSPIPNLFFGLGWRAGLTDGEPNGTITNRYPRIGDNYLGIQVGVGYTFENIGSFRLQFFGPYPFEYDATAEDNGFNSLINVHYPTGFPISLSGTPPSASDAAKLKFNSIQTGFKVTALESMGLNLDVVAKIPLSVTAKADVSGKEYTGTAGSPIKIGVVAEFATGNISVNGGIGVALPYTAFKLDDEDVMKPLENDAIELKFNVEPAIKIGDSVTVGADIAFVLDPGQVSGFKQDGVYTELPAKNGKDKLGTPMDLGLGVFVKYAVGAGTLKTGFAVNIPNVGGLDFVPGTDDDYHNAVNFKIPLTITVGF